MPKTPTSMTPSGPIAREVLRVGVGRFVTRFARRFRVDGLPARAAAEAAARELAQEAIAGFLGIPGVRYPARRTSPKPQDSRGGGGTRGQKVLPNFVRPSRRKRDPDLERLDDLKRFVSGGGRNPDPKKGKKTT